MTDSYLSVPNWEKFQHYQTPRSSAPPAWIKLHRTLLDDYAYTELPDSAKGHLVGIWILASQTGNRIPDSAGWIARRIGANTPVDLDLLLARGFLTRASTLLAGGASRTASTNREEKNREEKSSAPRARRIPSGDHARVVDHWCSTWLTSRGEDYAFGGGRDGKSIKEALRLAEGNADEACRRIDRMFDGHDRWLLEHATPQLLVSKWNDLSGAKARPVNGKARPSTEWEPM